jgi:AcrR family transcriptional regulator
VIAKPNRDRRSERHKAIRREILDAAWAAAHESSIAGLTLRDIASRAGMQQPSLYSHFASIAEHYFDFAVADLARHQLMDVNVVPNFQPSAEAYAPAVEVYGLMLDLLRGLGITTDEDADTDTYTALIGGLVNQELANDPGGQRWRRLIPRVLSMFADDLSLP